MGNSSALQPTIPVSVLTAWLRSIPVPTEEQGSLLFDAEVLEHNMGPEAKVLRANVPAECEFLFR